MARQAPLAALVLLHAFVLDTFRVDGASMREMLLPGDWLVSKLGASHLPERGAIVVFRLPQNPSLVLVKRVAGLPGCSCWATTARRAPRVTRANGAICRRAS